jgi:hypothetical protein
MALWTFMDFVASNGTNHVRKWYRKELTIQQESDLDELIRILGKMEAWSRDDFKWLSGNLQGLGEVRLKNKPPIRLIGCKGRHDREIVFLIGCFHKDNRYEPPNALDTALSRKRDFEQNRGSLVDHDSDDNEAPEEK